MVREGSTTLLGLPRKIPPLGEAAILNLQVSYFMDLKDIHDDGGDGGGGWDDDDQDHDHD